MARTNQDRMPSGGYSDEFKIGAVRLVTEEGYSMAAAAEAVGVSQLSLKTWVAKYGPPPKEPDNYASVEELRQENKRLNQLLKRVEMEREVLSLDLSIRFFTKFRGTFLTV
jgi:transposase